MRCEACGSRKLATLLDNLSHHYERNGAPGVWRYCLLECQQCSLGFIEPKPPREVLETFYDQTYGSYIPNSNLERELKSGKYWIAKQRYSLVSSKGLQAIIRTILGITAEWISGRTISFTLGMPLQLSRDANIFELGYGSGDWLILMSTLGYENLSGYDIDVNSENLSRLESAGVKVSSGLFLENDYPDSHFDCIRLEHVLEHLPHPIEVLVKCRNMLKPGGWLLINGPCKDSWSMWLSLRHCPALELPRHLYHHSLQSATMMIKAAGLNVLGVKVYSVIEQLAGTINNMLLARSKASIPSLFFTPFAPLYKLFGAVTGKGDFLTIFAERRRGA